MIEQRQRYAIGYALGFAIFCIISALISLILIIPMMNFSLPLPSKNVSAQTNFTVVIDAGHGGEDGGCEGYGLVEKELNLDIALKIAEMLENEGVSVVLTRETDVLLYDKNDNYEGKKKALDLRKRVEITANCENPIFVSIHMNYFAQTKYSGLQVYYAEKNEGSYALAAKIQENVRARVQPENKRIVKAGKDIYVLENLNNCAVLIECGFLTNESECKKLSEKEYQKELSFAIICGIIEYIE